jgi:hypothetical protein
MASPVVALMAILRSPAVAADLSARADLWVEIKRVAEIHRFSGWLAHSSSPWLPASERPWRDQVLMTHHRRHVHRLQSLRRLVEAFRNEGLACVSLKGPLLAERFYPVPFLRPSNDLDLLIREDDVGAAARLMFRLGYRLEGNFPWYVHRRASHHLEFKATNISPEVEVHYALRAGRSRFEPSEFLERSVIWKSPAGFEASVLSSADEAFHSCVHAAGHAFHRLRWVCDLITIANSLTPRERTSVRDLALKWGQTGPFVAASMVAREFFDEVPRLDCREFPIPWLWSELTPRQIRRMVERVEGIGGNLRMDSTLRDKIGCRLDLCRIAGSPLTAAQLAASVVGRFVRTRLYRLRHPADPGALTRTLPD